ncbi:PGF-pre-PGF domain-containing protein [Nanoarchaeota archaeon]
MNKTALYGLMALAMVSLATAIPVPLGIDGIVYELDGTTPVMNGVTVIVNDTTAGIVINTTTGLGSPGRYSVVINGNTSDHVIVTASNPVHSSSRETNLTGIIHNFDITLNMTLPDLAPSITSTPNTTAIEDLEYTYQVMVLEWNEDNVSYSVEGPSGMSIDTNGLLSWTPTDDDVGSNNVIVNASDGSLSSTQEYTLTVTDTNDAPVITSTPNTTAVVGEHYFYDIDATDDGGSEIYYSITSDIEDFAPVSNGSAGFVVESIHVGSHDVFVQVSDGLLAVNQTYTLTISEEAQAGTVTENTSTVSSGMGGGGGGYLIKESVEKPENSTGTPKWFENDGTVTEIINNNEVLVWVADERPHGLERIARTVYKYLKLEGSGETTIRFRVDKEWMEERRIDSQDIILSRYNGSWEDLDTAIIDEGPIHMHYEATSPGLSIFTITVKKGVHTELPAPEVREIKQPWLIYGTVSRIYRDVAEGTPMRIENLASGQSIELHTGGPSPGFYSVVLYGNKGDDVRISILGEYDEVVEVKLIADKLLVNIRIGSMWAYIIPIAVLVVILLLLGLYFGNKQQQPPQQSPQQQQQMVQEEWNYFGGQK